MTRSSGLVGATAGMATQGDEAGAHEADYEPVGGGDGEEYALPADAGFADYLLHPYKTFEAYLQCFFNNFGWRFAVQLSSRHACHEPVGNGDGEQRACMNHVSGIENDTLVAKIGSDTAEERPPEVQRISTPNRPEK